MEYIKRKDRVLKASGFNAGIKSVDGTVKTLGEYSKWHNLKNDMGRIQVKMDIIEVYIPSAEVKRAYYLKDELGYMASIVCGDLKEVKQWLTDHGFKTIKDWYIEDNGMSEETWKIWNSEGEG